MKTHSTSLRLFSEVGTDIVVFTVRPHQRDARFADAALRGGFFGFVAYATYDLTNQATMVNWP